MIQETLVLVLGLLLTDFSQGINLTLIFISKVEDWITEIL